MYTKLVSEYRYKADADPADAQFDLMHYGYICIVDENSKVIYHAGDCSDFVFYRSASKPIQALPVFKYGLDRTYGLEEEESVILSASHSGQEIHVKALESILRKIGFSEDILCMKPTVPVNVKANEARIRKGIPPRKIYHNCSGKHLALLMIQKHLGGVPGDYWKTGTPVFYETAETIKKLAETDRLHIGTDGCGVPVFAAEIRNIAISFKNLACPDRITDDALQRAAAENTARIQKYPLMLSGEGRICSIMNKDPNIIAKGGANGVYGIGLRKERLGIAFKLVDGTEEAWPFIAQEILASLGALTPEHKKRLEALHPTYFVNDNDLIVGERRSEFRISL